MLVLSRKREETIVIGKDGKIRLRILSVRGDGLVRIGVEAPKDVPVRRGELNWTHDHTSETAPSQ